MPKYSFNTYRNGIEITFENLPSVSLREEMKANGWKWNHATKVWYITKADAALKYAKKLCNETPTTDSSTKKSPRLDKSTTDAYTKTAPQQESSDKALFEFTDAYGNKTSIEIKKVGNNFSISSTTNMILCVDCNRMHSIHATACPFCGCPLVYTAEQFFNRFNVKNIQAVAPQKTELEIKEELYDTLQNIGGFYFFYHESIEKTVQQLETAIKRVKYIKENKDKYYDFRDLKKVIFSSETEFQNGCAEQIAEKINRENLRKELQPYFDRYHIPENVRYSLLRQRITLAQFESRYQALVQWFHSMSEEHYDLLTSNEAQIKAAAMEFRKQRAQNAGTLYTHKKCAGDCSTCTREKCLNMK